MFDLSLPVLAKERGYRVTLDNKSLTRRPKAHVFPARFQPKFEYLYGSCQGIALVDVGRRLFGNLVDLEGFHLESYGGSQDIREWFDQKVFPTLSGHVVNDVFHRNLQTNQ